MKIGKVQANRGAVTSQKIDMAGLDPAIHVLLTSTKKGVDARVKPGHDEAYEAAGHGCYTISRNTFSTALRCSGVSAACGGTGSPTS